MNPTRMPHPRSATFAGLIVVLLIAASPARPDPVVSSSSPAPSPASTSRPSARHAVRRGQPIVLVWSVDRGLLPQSPGCTPSATTARSSISR